MTKLWMTAGLTFALLAGCSEYTGGNAASSDTALPYDRYLAEREIALIGKGATPDAIPVAYRTTAPAAQVTAVPAATKPARAVRTKIATTAAASTDVRPATYATSETVLTRYAVAVSNNPGVSRFKRVGRADADTTEACSAFSGAEAAQVSFIARGGPNADPLGLDPDGDGFVCGWDPVPYRKTGR